MLPTCHESSWNTFFILEHLFHPGTHAVLDTKFLMTRPRTSANVNPYRIIELFFDALLHSPTSTKSLVDL